MAMMMWAGIIGGLLAHLAKDDELTRMLDDAGKPPRDPAKKIGWRQWYTTMYRTPYDPAARSAFYYNPEDPAAWIADLYAFPNWSLLSHYINIGIALAFISTPVVTYLVETANASAAQVNTYSAVTYLPWCLKIFFGLQSDLVPLCGMHRRSYYLAGWAVFIACNVWLMALGEPSVNAVLLLSFVMTMGCLVSDTVADAIILECAKFEPPETKGNMRTHGYLVRMVGATGGSLLGSLIYNGVAQDGSWSWGFTIAECFALQVRAVSVGALASLSRG